MFLICVHICLNKANIDKCNFILIHLSHQELIFCHHWSHIRNFPSYITEHNNNITTILTTSMCNNKSISWASIADIIQVPEQICQPWYPSRCSCSSASTSPSVAHPCEHQYSGILIKHVNPLFLYCDWSICAYKLYVLSIYCSPLCIFIYDISTCVHLYISFPFICIYEGSICTLTYMKFPFVYIHIWSFHLCTYMYEVCICAQYIYEMSICAQYIHMYEVSIPFDCVLLSPFLGCRSGHPFEHIGKFHNIYPSIFNCILWHFLMQSSIDMVICSGNTHCSNVMCKNDWYFCAQLSTCIGLYNNFPAFCNFTWKTNACDVANWMFHTYIQCSTWC